MSDPYGNVIVSCPCCNRTVTAAPENLSRIGNAMALRWPVEMCVAFALVAALGLGSGLVALEVPLQPLAAPSEEVEEPSHGEITLPDRRSGGRQR